MNTGSPTIMRTLAHTPQRAARLAVLACIALMFTGCATRQPMDYAAFKEARPKSILVLPPVNNSPDVNGSLSVLSHMTQPLAEAGYYVLPVTLMAETFKQNGLSSPAEIHGVSTAKLQEIFGADAALYVTIHKYGSTYVVFNSVAEVSATARLVDLKTGTLLWSGTATANNDQNNNQGGGLAGLLVAAIVKQILNNVTDASHVVAGMASQQLLAAGQPNGILYGPRSPSYGKD